MKRGHPNYWILLILFIGSSGLYAQTDQEQILAIRKASNAALQAYDNLEVLSYLTDDALTTTGNGTLLCGKEALAAYVASAGASKTYWIRNTKEIEVNEKSGLAWERGVWNGYDPEKGADPIIHGKYSAQWAKIAGTWKIKSQLFVTLGEE